jgi:hypothetical protein
MLMTTMSIVSATQYPIELPEPLPECPRPYSTTLCLYQWINRQDFGSHTYSTFNTYTTTKSGGSFDKWDLGTYLVGTRSLFDKYDTFKEYLDEHYVTKEEFNALKRSLGEWQGQYYSLVMQVAELQKKC